METISVIFLGAFSNLISWTIFGLFAGILAKWIIPGKSPGGFLMTVLLGIGGALLGGYLSSQILEYEIGDKWSFSGFVSAIIGAIIIVFVWKQIGKNMK